ncbi:hypothetical protein L2E82_33203 [Cichorium intybus]|uniref:Uncharacterized protein n=1 Tax=Cichorium intybus TaxID=13427 RepID=A0ACB9BJH9_CICIN|nr:hypothetical protein L2E82_33203 [Cichorium intybus]
MYIEALRALGFLNGERRKYPNPPIRLYRLLLSFPSRGHDREEPTLPSSHRPSSPAAGISGEWYLPSIFFSGGISGDCSPHSFRRIPITIDLHLTICFLRQFSYQQTPRTL